LSRGPSRPGRGGRRCPPPGRRKRSRTGQSQVRRAKLRLHSWRSPLPRPRMVSCADPTGSTYAGFSFKAGMTYVTCGDSIACEVLHTRATGVGVANTPACAHPREGSGPQLAVDDAVDEVHVIDHGEMRAFADEDLQPR